VLGVVFKAGGQDDRAGNTVRGIVQSAQAVCHAVHNAQADVGKAHAGDVLRQGHAFAAFSRVGHCAAQILTDQADSLQVEHIGLFRGTLGDQSLNGMCQGVHAGGGGQAFGHRAHHISVNNGDLGDVVGVHTDKLALFLHVGDDIVDGDLGRGAGGGGNRDCKDCVLLGGGYAFQAADIGKFGVVDDNADSFGGIHRRTAADGHDAVCARSLEGLDAVLNVFNCGVGLDFTVDAVGKVGRVQQGGDFGGNAKLDQVRVRADKRLCIAAGGQFRHNVFNRAFAVVGNGVQNNAVCHKFASVCRYWFQAPTTERCLCE